MAIGIDDIGVLLGGIGSAGSFVSGLLGGGGSEADWTYSRILENELGKWWEDRWYYENYVRPYELAQIQTAQNMLPIYEDTMKGLYSDFQSMADPSAYAAKIADMSAAGQIPFLRQTAETQKQKELESLGSTGRLRSGLAESTAADLNRSELNAVNQAYTQPYQQAFQNAQNLRLQVANALTGKAATPVNTNVGYQPASTDSLLNGYAQLASAQNAQSNDMWSGLGYLGSWLQNPNTQSAISGLWSGISTPSAGSNDYEYTPYMWGSYN